MLTPEGPSKNTERTLERVLSLSWRISCSSPPMKPFIRFSQGTDELYRTVHHKSRNLFWDFDDTLQKILLQIVRAIATPDQLAQACIDRWKSNFEHIFEVNRKEWQAVVEGKSPFHYRDNHRISFVLDRLVPKSRFLYVGSGRGIDCLSFAKQGHHVFGIDTNFPLNQMAEEWSRLLALPFQPISMDVMDLGFARGTFDNFLIEFYGHQPTRSQSLLLQKSLARVLRPGGTGFVVGCRKNYASYWFMMRQFYPVPMVLWLANQAGMDYYWNKPDGNEEKLVYGLYYRSHTVDSLAHELGYAFNVKECFNEEKDPRYVMCIVEPKENVESLPEPDYTQNWEGQVSPSTHLGINSVNEILEHIDTICNFLEAHENQVQQFFKNNPPKGQTPLQNVPVEISKFFQLLEVGFRSLPDFDGTC